MHAVARPLSTALPHHLRAPRDDSAVSVASSYPSRESSMYPEQDVNGWTVIREPRHQSGSDYSEDGEAADMDVDSRDYHQQQWYRQGREVRPSFRSCRVVYVDAHPSVPATTPHGLPQPVRRHEHVCQVSQHTRATRVCILSLFPCSYAAQYCFCPTPMFMLLVHTRSVSRSPAAYLRRPHMSTTALRPPANSHFRHFPRRLGAHRLCQSISRFPSRLLFHFHHQSPPSPPLHMLQTHTPTSHCCIPTTLPQHTRPIRTSTIRHASLGDPEDTLSFRPPPHSSPTVIFPQFLRRQTVWATALPSPLHLLIPR